ncbi:hypothetical protein HGRIS_007608 [Hohenbuehelia grisea]|uniref:Maintenance of telomere capping protein 1 n=1 Tax=Hohenbuehelia grisea TaxID=104357 RepID=A0ABR3J5U3_9AGAR
MSKSKSKQEEALQFLDDLDSFTPVEAPNIPAQGSPAVQPASVSTNPPATNPQGEAEVLAFIDEITQKSSEPTVRAPAPNLDAGLSVPRSGTPTLRKSMERVRVGASPSPLLSSATTGYVSGGSRTGTPPLKAADSDKAKPEGGPGGWGWGSVWNTASAAIQQAKTVVDEQVKNLPKNEQARKWSEGVMEYAKNAQLDKLGKDFKQLGLSTLTDILNVVAPPISEHEIIQVWLSHDMKGYDGIESLVYRSLSRILEQVEGGDLIVNRGNTAQPKDASGPVRDLSAVDGYEAALKLAQANLDEVIKANADKTKQPEPSSTQVPTTYSHIYLRVQPFMTSHTLAAPSPVAGSADAAAAEPQTQTHSQLQFILQLSDPQHQLVHTTTTQAVPGHWLELWDKYDWVEDLVAEALRVGVEVVGQEYLVRRMGWGKTQEAAQPEPKGEAVETETKAAPAS